MGNYYYEMCCLHVASTAPQSTSGSIKLQEVCEFAPGRVVCVRDGVLQGSMKVCLELLSPTARVVGG